MLTFDNPVATANALSDYVTVHYSSIPERLQPLALAAVRERSPAVSIVKGMELCYAILCEEGEGPNRELTLQTLGALAFRVSEDDFFNKTERALSIQRVVKYELGELAANATPPEWPEVDPEYTNAAVTSSSAPPEGNVP